MTTASLVIISYNQENYVKSAIESALNQDYSSLEIIISDDASTDKSKAIIEDVAHTYSGPHRLKTVLNSTNKGTLANFQSGVAVSTGDVVLCGACDDLFKPDRVSIMVKAWEKTGAQALHSAYDIIDENGAIVSLRQTPNAALHPVFDYIKDKAETRFVNGATSAYTGDFLRSLPPVRGRVFHEDALLTLIVHALGYEVHLVPTVTIDYRVHNSSFSNNKFLPSSAAEFSDMERRLARFAGSSRAYLDYFMSEWLPFAPDRSEILDRIDIDAVDRARRTLSRTQRFAEADLRGRVELLLTSRNLLELKEALFRVPGLTAFGHAKALASWLSQNHR